MVKKTYFKFSRNKIIKEIRDGKKVIKKQTITGVKLFLMDPSKRYKMETSLN